MVGYGTLGGIVSIITTSEPKSLQFPTLSLALTFNTWFPLESSKGATNEVDVCVPCTTSSRITSYNSTSPLVNQVHSGVVLFVGE